MHSNKSDQAWKNGGLVNGVEVLRGDVQVDDAVARASRTGIVERDTLHEKVFVCLDAHDGRDDALSTEALHVALAAGGGARRKAEGGGSVNVDLVGIERA